MSDAYIKQDTPFVVPTDDGKHIEEHFGIPSTGMKDVSVARMEAPPGWSEPAQTPEFDELTLMVKGRKRIIVGEEAFELSAGQLTLVRAGTRVQYSNPFDEPAEYWSVCRPAFSPDRVHRE
ncbi:MAG: cupin domain-containing protein [Halomonas sp.]|uniref:cupin domain-containing protein n=1 Tax=Halomonas sp. TaxID=1486246 RepID=UPI002ACE9F91|nr:cupin domain-containing protein [Halomonas sp.]MDZ7852622.1 cupin domain-containing protein [Halomonas sp.]